MADQLTIGLLITAALADSINPCVFGVLIFLLGYMTTVFKSNVKMLIGGAIYLASVYLTYLLIGLGVLTLTFTSGFSSIFYWIAALIAIAAGLFEIKDFFFYGKWFSLQMIPGGAARIRRYTTWIETLEVKHPWLSLSVAGLLGFVVVLFELPCTGAPYLAVLGLLSAGDFATGLPLLLLYNLIFILPLFVIIGMVYVGHASEKLESWRRKYRTWMRLGIGLFLIGLGIYMILTIV